MNALKRRIAALERMQTTRIELVNKRKAMMDAVVEAKQREIDNLKQALAREPAPILRVAQ